MRKQLISGPGILRVEFDLLFSEGAPARRIPVKSQLTEGELKLPGSHDCRCPQAQLSDRSYGSIRNSQPTEYRRIGTAN
jgi:hypothetical protein